MNPFKFDHYEPESQFIWGQMSISPNLDCGGQGVYVDLGCAHPINKSLTHFCRDFGWRGLAIDGNIDFAPEWLQYGYIHHFVCAVLSDQPTARFVVHENSFTSRISDLPENDHPEKWGIKRIEERSTVSLNHLLDVHDIGKIDLLCCDLEGHEFEVLKTLDWEKHSPAWVIAEYVTAGEDTDPRLCNFLLERGYEVVHMTQSNLIYRRK